MSVAGATTLTAIVKAVSGKDLPTGHVYFTLGQTTLGSIDLSAVGTTAVARVVVNASQLAIGVNTLTAFSGGASTFLSSTATTTVTVTTAGSSVTTTVNDDQHREAVGTRTRRGGGRGHLVRAAV